MKLSKKFLRSGVAYGVGLAISTGVSALQLEEVVVTAQKRSESVQDVPIAINAISGDQLNELGVHDSSDLTSLYPNLSLNAKTSINSGFSIRGVGTSNFHVTAEQAVGQYSDDVSLVSPFVGQFGLFDLDRVEILRGPQNTLFGRNTTGGAINFISNKPQVGEGMSGSGRFTIGNEGAEEFEGAIGFSLSETVAARFAVQTVNRDGVFTDVVDNEDTGRIERHSGRFQVMWEPSDLTQVLLNTHVGYNRSDRGPRKALGLWEEGSPNIGTSGNRGPGDCGLLTSSSATSRFENANNCVSASGARVVNPSTDDWNDVRDIANTIANVDFKGAFINVSHNFEEFNLVSITSYDKTEALFQENTSSTGIIGFFPGQDAQYEVFSQELRLASTTDGAFRWLAGGYYSNEDDVLGTVIRNGADGTPPFTVVPSTVVDQEVDILSVYGQVEYDLTDVMTLTVGLRYTKDEKEGTTTSRVLAGTVTGFPGAAVAPADFFYDIGFVEAATVQGVGICPPPVGGLPCEIGPTAIEQSLEEVGGKIGLDYRFSDDVMAYVSYSRGFKSGAFDTRALAAFSGNADDPVGPEFLDAYELGVKSTLLDGTLELNGAIFYYDWEDYQTFSVDDNNGVAYLNVPISELKGIEVEVKWALGDSWYIQGGVGLLDSEITDDGNLPGVVEGSVLPNTPELTWSGVVSKDISLDNGVVNLQTTFSYKDEAQTGLREDPRLRHESTFFINARASYVFGNDEQYELALWGNNLTEEKECVSIGSNGTLDNAITCLVNPGMAFYGITGSVNF